MQADELKKLMLRLERQRTILYRCADTFKDIQFLQGNSAVSEIEKELLEFDVLRTTQGLMWNFLILELYKLYSKSKNDNYRLNALLESLKRNYKNLPFKIYLSEEKIDEYLRAIESEEFMKHYTKLKSIRDEHVAHLDVDGNEVHFSNREAQYFVELTERILRDIIDPSTIGGSSIYIPHPANFSSFIKQIATYKGVYDKLENGLMNPVERNKMSSQTEKEFLRILGKKNFIVEGIG